MKQILRFVLIIAGLFLALSPKLCLADTGKIAGTVLDEAGDAAIGASVQIVGTQIGASVGVDGSYVILAIQPGTYQIRISSVGYGAKTFSGVEVSSGQTTTLNATLSEEALQIGDVDVIWKKPAVELGNTGKSPRFDRKELQQKGVSSVTDFITKQPGFKVDPSGGIHVRGGRDHEALVKVDGQDYRDPLNPTSKRLVNFSALNVQEIEIMTGGDARHGGFQSALINVTTPEGSMTDYSGVFEWRTDRVIPKYSFHTDQYDYSFSGPVPLIDKLVGKQKLSIFTSGSSRLSNTYTPYNINRESNDYLGLGFNIPERQTNDFTTYWKLTYKVDPSKKLNLTFSRDFSQADIYPDGTASIDGNYGWRYKYNVQNRPWSKTSRQTIGLSFQHNISKKTFYEVSVGNFRTTTIVQPRGKTPGQFTLSTAAEDENSTITGGVDADRDGFTDGYVDANHNGKYDGAGEGYDDANANGLWDRGEDWVDLNGNGVYDGAEPWTDRPNAQGINNVGVYDTWDPYTDVNGNGRWDPAEPQLAEQDWNHNGAWDGERFIDANGNGLYDGSGEGYDDKNRDGGINHKDLFSDTEDADPTRTGQYFAEPFVDGDLWNDTGEPYVNLAHLDSVTGEYLYNNFRDGDEPFFDLPTSNQGGGIRIGAPSTNGQYDGPNNVFDEYELWTIPAGMSYGMDPRYPVLYTWEDVRQGIWNAGQEWVHMAVRTVGVDTVSGYLVFDDDICSFSNMPSGQTRSTWKNVTYHDEDGTPTHRVFNIANSMWDAGKEEFADYNDNGVEDPIADGFLNPGRWDNTAFYMKSEAIEWSNKFDITSQATKYHELKAGWEIKYRDLTMNSISGPDQLYANVDVPLPDGSPYPDRGSVRDFYSHKPWEGAVYFQDKMEFEGMIVRAGVRSDFVIQSNNILEETQKQVDTKQPGALLAQRGRFVVAPRLGISHPISEKAKLYFNYGHYYQTPSFSYFYQSATANISPNTTIGNPNLEYEKTVSYELGVNTEFAEDWVVDIAGYYRDKYNEIGTVSQQVGPITLNRYFNLGYGRARGFEFSLKKNFSEMWALTLNYDYSYAFGKESAAMEGLNQRAADVPENRDEHPLGWDQTHTVSAFLTVNVSEKDKKEIFGFKIPRDWVSTVEFSYGSGYPYTPSTYVTGKSSSQILANSARYPISWNCDLKFDKFWTLSKRLKLTTGIEIYNLFDRINVRSLYAETGNAFDSSHEDNITERSDGNLGDDYDHNPRNYSSPRQIMLHLKLGME